MKTPIIIATAGLVPGLIIGALAQQTMVVRPTYMDPAYRFSIQAPKFPAVGAEELVIPVSFQAPPRGGFAANINVMVQPIKTTRKEFRDLSVAQFEQLGIKVKSERNLTVSGKEAVEWDYENEIQGRRLRILQRAVVDADRVILATCTAPAAGFTAYEPELRASLASLKLLPTSTPR